MSLCTVTKVTLKRYVAQFQRFLAGTTMAPPSHDRRRAQTANANQQMHVPMGSVIFILASALVVAAAVLARQGYRGRDHTVGIDLGTTYSVVAISQNNNITVIADENGHLITPSIVAFLENGGHLVGRDARDHRTKDPRHTIFNAKRFIGQTLKDAADDAKAYEFSTVSVNSNDQHSDVCFSLNLPGHPRCITPIQVGSHIVRYLKAQAQRFVGHDQINKAVIAVPVGFNKKQRAATVAAFNGAGLQVTRVLEEPTAAAIAYGLHQQPSVNFILVFDFGGGTLDVSLLFSRSGSITVIDTMGDNHLGGEDVDAIVAESLERQLKLKLGDDEGANALRGDISHHDLKGEMPCTHAGIRRVAEQLKRKLSDVHEASVSCVVDNDGSGRTLVELTMTRATLEELCAPLLERTLVPINDILATNSMTSSDIDAVVLVGGSTRLPWVRQRLAREFQGRVLTDIDPDVAVAYGAARTVD